MHLLPLAKPISLMWSRDCIRRKQEGRLGQNLVFFGCPGRFGERVEGEKEGKDKVGSFEESFP
jgi:hypothetical protein